MKPYPSLTSQTFSGIAAWILGVGRQRTEDVTEISNLKSKYLTGRIRADRTFPTGNGDVNTTDKEGDIVRSNAFEVVLFNDAGTLKWARSALDVTW